MYGAVLIVLLAAAGPTAQPEVIDQVIAVVDDSPILLSDLCLASIVRLVEPRPDDSPARYGERLLEARISLELQHADLGIQLRRAPPEPRIAAVLEHLLGSSTDRENRLSALEHWGLSVDDVRELAVRIAEIESYIEGELRPQVRPSLDEVRALYENEIVPEMLRAGGEPPPFESMAGELSRLVRERQLNRRLEAWLAEAATRHTVIRYRDWAPNPLAPFAP